MAQALKFKTIKDLRAFLRLGGRKGAKADFSTILSKAVHVDKKT